MTAEQDATPVDADLTAATTESAAALREAIEASVATTDATAVARDRGRGRRVGPAPRSLAAVRSAR